jgi:hypothetical protein
MMSPLLASMSEEVVILFGGVVVGGFIIALTGILTSHYRKLQRDDMAATLKMEMIQRGMSVDEIERVLEAQMETFADDSSRHYRRHKFRESSRH